MQEILNVETKAASKNNLFLGDLKVPNVRSHKTGQGFFTEFYDLNRGNFSHRAFAAALDWPSSFLADLVSGRKRLSISRALEFAKHFNMTAMEAERLVIFSLSDHDNSTVHEFVKGFLEGEGSDFEVVPKEVPADQMMIPPEMFADFHLLMIHSLLSMFHTMPWDQLADLCPAFPEFKDLDFVKSKLKIMHDMGIISGEWPNFKVEKINLCCASILPVNRVGHFELLRRISQLENPDVSWNMGNIVFPRSSYPELQQRIAALRSWILTTVMREFPKGQPALEKSFLLQVDLCLSHLMDMKKADALVHAETSEALS